MIRLLHKLKIVKGVVLIDRNDRLYITRRRKDRSTKRYYCYVLPFTKTGKTYLKDDHTVEGKFFYIKRWKYL